MRKIAKFTISVAAIVVGACAVLTVKAQGFANDGIECYSWSGGEKSAGILTKCRNDWPIPVAKVKTAPIVVLPPVATPTATPIRDTPRPVVVHRKKRAVPRCAQV